MKYNILESMDLTAFSVQELARRVARFVDEGWSLYSDIDESVYTTDSGLSLITYTRTLVRYASSTHPKSTMP